MEWLTDLFGALTNGLSGGLIGAIGGVVTGFLKLREKKLDYDHEIALRDKDKELMIAEAENAVRLEQARKQTVAEQGAADAFTASQVNARVDIPAGMADKTSPWVCNLFVLGELVKGQVRVWLTLASVGTVIVLSAHNMPEAFKLTISTDLVKSVVFMAEMSAGWWFAQRQIAK